MARVNQSQISEKEIEGEDKEEELIPVGPGADPPEEPDEKLSDGESEEDTRLSEDAQEDDDDSGRDAIRSLRKKKRQNRKANLHRDRAELNFLREQNRQLEERVASLDTRVGGSEVATVQQQMSQIQQQIELANNIMKATLTSDDPSRGEDFIKAQEARDQLVEAMGYLKNRKNAFENRNTEQEPTAKAQPRISELQKRRAGEWFSRNSWYRPNGADSDSKKVLEIDRQIESDGFDPASDDYWDEFEDRVKEALPHTASEDDDEDIAPPKKNGSKPRSSNGPIISVGGKERPLKKGEIYISRERRQAMEEAGVWDDPKLRKRILDRYSEYDRNASKRRSSSN